MSDLAERLWYGTRRPLWPLWPLAWLYRLIAARRRQRLQARAEPLAAPVIVVGNITAGGTGKSPLTAWLAGYLRDAGWRPVILSRGYGAARPADHPAVVTPESDPAVVGDEPVMLAMQTECPVVVHPRRLESAQWAMAQSLGNLFLCDDGLQHYALARDLELAVFDGTRGVGNGAPIPVGPLREPVERLDDVKFVVVNGTAGDRVPSHPHRLTMTLEPVCIRNLNTGERQPTSWLRDREVRAIAGIGNPGRFFATVEALGAKVDGDSFPDHHRYSSADIESDGRPVLMTAKDAVKIRSFAHSLCWVLEVEARLPVSFGPMLESALSRKLTQRGLALPVENKAGSL